MKYSIAAVLVLLLCSGNNPDSKKALKVVPGQKEFYTYKWNKFEIPRLKNLTEYQYHFEGNGDLGIRPGFFWLLSTDEKPIKLTITKDDDPEFNEELMFYPKVNPSFESSWRDLGPGELPEHLTNEQFMIFRLYRRFDALYLPVPEFEWNCGQSRVTKREGYLDSFLGCFGNGV